jgi:hypothetical protein
MPYTLRKVRKQSCYRITNPKTKRVFAKCSTKQNAIKQLRLLRALQYNKNFRPLSSNNVGKKSGARNERRTSRNNPLRIRGFTLVGY